MSLLLAVFLYCYTVCYYHYAQSHCAECRHAECIHSECRYAMHRLSECCGASLTTRAIIQEENCIKLIFFSLFLIWV